MFTSLTLVAAFQVEFNAGTPSITEQNGGMTSSITDNGAGDITVNLKEGIDADDFYWFAMVDGALAASQLTAFGIVHTSDTAKRITILREGAAGAVSLLSDVNFTATMWRKNPS